ncbi:MAG: anion permease, partial [Lachnospiraceae bacterium]|nr:anion permease [Lachnospiraceae bacterium]
MMSIGTLASPVMPSTTAKLVLGAKLADSSADVLGYEHHSKGRVGLYMAAASGFMLMAPAFISSSFLGYSMVSSLPEGYRDVTWMQWFLAMIPWAILFFIIMFFAISLFYGPKRKMGEKKAAESKTEDVPAEKHKFTKNEAITAVIMIVCLIFWILEKQSGINSGVVALIGGLACFATGILKNDDLKTAVPWGLILLIGAVFALGDVFSATGISNWIVSLLGPLLLGIKSPVLIIIFVFVSTVIVRFALASQTACIMLLPSVFGSIVIAAGINPFVVGVVIYSAIPVWILSYQNPTFMAGVQAMDGSISHSDTVKGAFIYLIVALIISLLMIPYWSLLGYL